MRLLLAFLAFLISCTASGVPTAHAPAPVPMVRWALAARPVSVIVPESHPCRAAIPLAVENVRAWGVDYLRVHVVSDEYASQLPEYGQISFRVELPENPRWLGSTIAPSTYGYLEWAAIRLRECSVNVITHELGHALGLPDVTDPSNLMNWQSLGAYGITADQLENVR